MSINNIQYLSREHIELIHDQAIKTFGGDYGYYDYTIGRIEGILDQQFPHFGYDKYPTIFLKAAMLYKFRFIKCNRLHPY